MKHKLLTLSFFLISIISFGQKVSVTPTITPGLFTTTDQITVKYNVTGTSLASLSAAYIWVWIPNQSLDAKYNINPATSAADPAKFTKSVDNGQTYFTISFVPQNFFNSNISAATQLGMLIKGTEWGNGQSIDHIANFGFKITLTSPSSTPVFVDNGENIVIQGTTTVSADFDIYVNDVLVSEQNATTSFSYNYPVSQSSGYGTIRVHATDGTNQTEEQFQYIVSTASPVVARPAGIIPGINYKNGDPSKVTLCLLAPGKSSVYVRGDFSSWEILPANLMNKDGELFWIEITGLTSGVEYGYQYLVDESLVIADPYADKILDPDDAYIPSTVYPNLKAYPTEVKSSTWYQNRVAVFQTGQSPYNWQVPNFEKPAKESLVIYELLVRDFVDSGHRSYETLADTIGYLKRLGVNAIELMPIMEFGGNDSWGYNPQFMFAPDKAYGPKEKLKEFIDVCHQNGIAVILDIALNHQDIPNPYVLMDFNFSTFKPNPTNKWFNVDATHPFSVFYDMNHESSYTKDYVDTINYYWLNEYKVDGFRFDLSKGFTQVNSGSDVSGWSNYDASRIAILKRMADTIWQHFPDAYVILEHLSVNSEEKVLAEYRAAEGKGMMLWGNMNYRYAQATKGFSTGSDIREVYHGERGWTAPRLVGYMESHDEERLMYGNLNYGYSGASYSVRTVAESAERIRAAATLFFTVPGPKMLWQFGELGYDYSINTCSDGTTISNDCRLAAKPVRWDYLDVADRKKIYDHIADINALRAEYDVFTSGTATFSGGTNLFKSIVLKNSPYTSSPGSADEMNAVVAGNFDITEVTTTVEFPHTGTWYNHFNKSSFNVTGSTANITLKPGEYRLFTDYKVYTDQVVTNVEELSIGLGVYPNPASDRLLVDSKGETIKDVQIVSQSGVIYRPSRVANNEWNIKELPAGFYIVQVKTPKGLRSAKLLKTVHQ
jgi:1,4-alpha-glucan branching enzyme